jgi:hypothetical protein
MRIFFIGEGRLGNQIFQYAALSSIAPSGAHLHAIGLEELAPVFELRGPRLRVLHGGLWFKRFAKYVLAPLLLRPLTRYLRLFSYACEPQQTGEHRGCTGRIEVRRGLIRSLLFVDGGYYQSSDFWHEVFPPRWLVLRDTWRARARAVLAQQAGRAPAKPFFLHVRRGDYAGYRTYGVCDLLLPTEYFRRAIETFRQRADFDLLVLVTDDATWAREAFADVADKILMSEDPNTDFALMASCAGGIVSNSTFSLAAALFMPAPDLVIAPEFWFGFRVRQWLPPRIRFDHPRIAYLPVLTGAPA